jgi:hypothetical protein
MELHHYRVVVRGVFDGLDAPARDRLRDALVDHDIFDSAFTDGGTLTYDDHLHAFNTRFALRVAGDRAEARAEVESVALARTADLLGSLDVSGRELRVSITDMADMWGSEQRRDRLREARRPTA